MVSQATFRHSRNPSKLTGLVYEHCMLSRNSVGKDALVDVLFFFLDADLPGEFANWN